MSRSQEPEIDGSGDLEVAFEWRGKPELTERAVRILQSDMHERRADWLERARAQVRNETWLQQDSTGKCTQNVLLLQEIDRLREVEEEEMMMRSQLDGGGIDDEYEHLHSRWGGTHAEGAAVSEAPAFYPVCALLPLLCAIRASQGRNK